MPDAQTQFNEALERARRARQGAAPVEKTSSAKLSDREKLSQLRESAEDAERLGHVLMSIGTIGIEQVAFSKLSGGIEGNPPATLSTGTEMNGQKPIKSNDSVKSEAYSGSVSDHHVTQMDVGSEGRPDLISDGNKAMLKSPKDVDGQALAGAAGSGGPDLSTGDQQNIENVKKSAAERKAAVKLRVLSGGAYVEGPFSEKVSYLRSLGLSGASDALAVFEKSASVRGLDIAAYCAERLHLLEPDAGDLMRTYAEVTKVSANLDGDISKAKTAVEGVVKATGTLPEASEIAEVAGVHEMAANLAIHQTAELIAATGGEVGGGQMGDDGAGPPTPEGAGAEPPPPGGVPGPPMGPPPEMGPPAAGPMPPGAPPMGPGMVAQASAVRPIRDVSILQRLINSVADNALRKQSASAELSTVDEPTPKPGNLVVLQGEKRPKSVGDLTPEEKGIIDNALKSNHNIVRTDYGDTEKFRAEGKDTDVSTSTKNPGHKGMLASTEPVKGTFEGDMSQSSALEGSTPGGEGAVEGSIKKSQIQKKVQAMFGKASGVMEEVEAGKGTSGGSSAGGTQSSANTQKLRSHITETGKTPSASDVAEQFGITKDEAQRILAEAITE